MVQPELMTTGGKPGRNFSSNFHYKISPVRNTNSLTAKDTKDANVRSGFNHGVHGIHSAIDNTAS